MSRTHIKDTFIRSVYGIFPYKYDSISDTFTSLRVRSLNDSHSDEKK